MGKFKLLRAACASYLYGAHAFFLFFFHCLFVRVSPTQTTFLTGAYDKQWNVGMTSIEASSCVSRSTAMAYSSPFIGALLADCLLGDYWVILLGMLFLYIPGLLIIVLTTIPKLLGEHFPKNLLKFGFLFLWPLGAGTIKSVVNIFGARQYHPQLQSSMLESYYVNFYMCINVVSVLPQYLRILQEV